MHYEPAVFPNITATEDEAAILPNDPGLLPREYTKFVVGLDGRYTLRQQKLARYNLGFSLFDTEHLGGESTPFAQKLQRVQKVLGFTDILPDLVEWGDNKHRLSVI